MCVLVLANGVLSIACFALLWSFFNEIASKNRPFLSGQGNRLKKVAVLMIICAFLTACSSTWAAALSTEPMPFSALIITFLSSLGVGLLYPLIFFCMALIFNYGLGLQTESDETL